MIVKHLKTKTVIELEPRDVEEYITCVNNLDSTVDTIKETQDMFISDLGHLDTLRWRLTDLLGLEWSSEKHRYVKTIGVKNGK
jgi:hypothetical protein|tara:strand:+ start:757 stop:1005 length:249 start_codon:yes stop_codon:yes gene_type:complete